MERWNTPRAYIDKGELQMEFETSRLKIFTAAELSEFDGMTCRMLISLRSLLLTLTLIARNGSKQTHSGLCYGHYI